MGSGKRAAAILALSMSARIPGPISHALVAPHKLPLAWQGKGKETLLVSFNMAFFLLNVILLIQECPDFLNPFFLGNFQLNKAVFRLY